MFDTNQDLVTYFLYEVMGYRGIDNLIKSNKNYRQFFGNYLKETIFNSYSKKKKSKYFIINRPYVPKIKYIKSTKLSIPEFIKKGQRVKSYCRTLFKKRKN